MSARFSVLSAAAVLTMLLGCGISSATAAAPGGPLSPGKDALQLRSTYQSSPNPEWAVTHSQEKGEEADAPSPTDPTPGDTETQEWTTCTGSSCTRHYRVDRWQRTDAPADPEKDPTTGQGPYDWIPVDWGSKACLINECWKQQFDLSIT